MSKKIKIYLNEKSNVLRLAIVVCLAFVFLYRNYSFILLTNSISFSAMVLSIFDAASLTQFGLFYLLILFAGDVCTKSIEHKLVLNDSFFKKKKTTLQILLHNFMFVCIYVGIIIATLFIIYIIRISDTNNIVLMRNYIDAPIYQAINSVILNILNYTFMLVLALFINIVTAQWYGTLSIFFFAWLQYNLRLMSSNIGVTSLLPIEHTLIYYDSIFLYSARPPISVSYTYWIIIFLLLYTCIDKVVVQRQKQSS